MKLNQLLPFLIMLFMFNACSKEVDNSKIITPMANSIKSIPQEELDSLLKKKIYFGHQSVGFNLIDGITVQLHENSNVDLNIAEGKDLDLFKIPVFAHATIGKNGDPKSKIDGFVQDMENGLGEKVDIAGFKFCYVDIKSDTDIQEVFQYYKMRMSELSSKYPNVKIIHFTTPLRSLQSGPKAYIKKMLGKDIGIEPNRARQKFNSLITNEFKDQLVFDIATFESTYPDNSREFTLVNGEKVYSMVPAYTFDGGHLSDVGKKKIGKDLILFLIELSNGRNNKKN